MAFLVLLAALGTIGTGYASMKLLFPGEGDRSGSLGWLYSRRLTWLRCTISVPLVLLFVLLTAAVFSVFVPAFR